MRTLYFDCFAGASGNMVLGALLDLGADRQGLESGIEALGLEGVSLRIEKVNRSGIAATHVEVLYEDQKHHRHLSDIEAIIDAGDLPAIVKDRAKKIFGRLAEAEASVHGISIEKVHFHEVGAVDAIVDIVGACICLESLGIERFACSRLHTGSGFVDMDHGRYPVPPPAVARLVSGFEVYSDGIEGELLTPTGAAIVTELCAGSEQIPSMKVDATGYGAGTRLYDKFPNVLRVVLGEASPAKAPDAELLRLIETNIDDSTPQVLGFVMDKAFELGALDCWFTPVHMKKNRPAALLSVLADPSSEAALKKLLFTETSTIGVRVRDVSRECLERISITVETEFGDVDVKVSRYEGEVVNIKPEFDQMRELAERDGVTLREVERAVMAELGNDNYFAAKG
ncbi:MAG: nickel pincer cofactor biosynthesis protein LarC [Acidobacteriota bacterium]|nr:MAG: nickel pincer cofactor biosynthesis protein LarC [Acidobacteriota bacterium]